MVEEADGVVDVSEPVHDAYEEVGCALLHGAQRRDVVLGVVEQDAVEVPYVGDGEGGLSCAEGVVHLEDQAAVAAEACQVAYLAFERAVDDLDGGVGLVGLGVVGVVGIGAFEHHDLVGEIVVEVAEESHLPLGNGPHGGCLAGACAARVEYVAFGVV